jgi:hypothetical protein
MPKPFLEDNFRLLLPRRSRRASLCALHLEVSEWARFFFGNVGSGEAAAWLIGRAREIDRLIEQRHLRHVPICGVAPFWRRWLQRARLPCKVSGAEAFWRSLEPEQTWRHLDVGLWWCMILAAAYDRKWDSSAEHLRDRMVRVEQRLDLLGLQLGLPGCRLPAPIHSSPVAASPLDSCSPVTALSP